MDASSFGAYQVCSDRAGVKNCARTPPRQLPEEPMSLVMNTAIGTWNGGASALDGKHWPAKFFVDYVRVWQKEVNVGCDPPDYPTRKYIEKNADFYGEPVSPSGYATCPEVYPPSAHHNAQRIRERGAAESTRRAAAAAAAAAARDTAAAADGASAASRQPTMSPSSLTTSLLSLLRPDMANTGAGGAGAPRAADAPDAPTRMASAAAAPVGGGVAAGGGAWWALLAGALLVAGAMGLTLAGGRLSELLTGALLGSSALSRYEITGAVNELEYEEFRQ